MWRHKMIQISIMLAPTRQDWTWFCKSAPPPLLTWLSTISYTYRVIKLTDSQHLQLKHSPAYDFIGQNSVVHEFLYHLLLMKRVTTASLNFLSFFLKKFLHICFRCCPDTNFSDMKHTYGPSSAKVNHTTKVSKWSKHFLYHLKQKLRSYILLKYNA